MTSQDRRFLVQLPLTAEDLPTAVRVARLIARSLSFHGLVDCDETTIAPAAQPTWQHPAFCPRLPPSGRRCLLRPDHDGRCARRLSR